MARFRAENVRCAWVVMAFFATVSFAGAPGVKANSGDYVSLLLIGGISSIDDVTVTSGNLELRNVDDTIAALGVAFGYNWRKKGVPVRSEIEYHYRIRFDFDTRVTGDAGFENQLQTHALLANAYYDFEWKDRWTLFVGGGIGWAQNVSEVDRVPLAGGAKTERTDRKNNLAWNIAVGAIYDLSGNWNAEFRYRYIDLGKVESGAHTDSRTIKAGSYTSHDLVMGVTYSF